MKSESNTLFDIGALLLLRQKAEALVSELYNGTAIWHPKSISKLSRLIAQKTGHTFSARALRMTVAEPVSDKTVIPRISNEKSRIDAICRALDYKNFMEFKQKEKDTINSLQIISSKKKIQKISMHQPEERIIYSISTDNNTPNVQQTSAFYFSHAILYHYNSDFKAIHKSKIHLDYEVKTMKVETYISTDTDKNGMPLSKIFFEGPFSHHTNGYLNAMLKNDFDESSVLMVALYTNHPSYQFKVGCGTHIYRSIKTNSCQSGKVIACFFDSASEVETAYIKPVPQNITVLLKNSFIEMPAVAYHKIEDISALFIDQKL